MRSCACFVKFSFVFVPVLELPISLASYPNVYILVFGKSLGRRSRGQNTFFLPGGLLYIGGPDNVSGSAFKGSAIDSPGEIDSEVVSAEKADGAFDSVRSMGTSLLVRFRILFILNMEPLRTGKEVEESEARLWSGSVLAGLHFADHVSRGWPFKP